MVRTIKQIFLNIIFLGVQDCPEQHPGAERGLVREVDEWVVQGGSVVRAGSLHTQRSKTRSKRKQKY